MPARSSLTSQSFWNERASPMQASASNYGRCSLYVSVAFWLLQNAADQEGFGCNNSNFPSEVPLSQDSSKVLQHILWDMHIWDAVFAMARCQAAYDCWTWRCSCIWVHNVLKVQKVFSAMTISKLVYMPTGVYEKLRLSNTVDEMRKLCLYLKVLEAKSLHNRFRFKNVSLHMPCWTWYIARHL